jgi:hypothetical protein
MAPRKKMSSKRRKSSKRISSRKRTSFVKRRAPVRRTTRVRKPTYSRASDGSIVVSHTEYISDISSSIAFSNQNYQINPSSMTLFPFLSNLANCYQQYDFSKLSFILKTTSSNALNSTNTALGTIIMSHQEDSLVSAPASKVEAEALRGAVSAPPSKSQVLRCDVRNRGNVFGTRYTLSGNNPSGSDLRLYNCGQINISAVGSQASAVVAELWVSYTIKLTECRLSASLAFNNNTGLYTNTAPASCAFNNLFVSSTSMVPNSQNQLSVSFDSSNTIRFPNLNVGSYLLAMSVQGPTGTTLSNSTTASTSWIFTNCAPLPIFKNTSSVDTCIMHDGASYAGTTPSCKFVPLVFAFKVTGQSPSIYVATSTIPMGSATAQNVIVLPINGRITSSV